MEEESEGIRTLEDDLRNDLLELKSHIEESNLLQGIPSSGMSSLYIPKDVDYFRRERRSCIQRSLQVTECMPIVIQADVMLQEMSNSEKPEFNSKTLPLLVHQYFIDRLHELVLQKHSHLLRWKRFCGHSAVVEALYPEYKQRLEELMSEYVDHSARAHRLASCREGFYAQTDQGIDELTNEDLLIYFRWLLGHLHSLKLVIQLSAIFQWIPIAYSSKLIKGLSSDMSEEHFIMPNQQTPSVVSTQSSDREMSPDNSISMDKESGVPKTESYAALPPNVKSMLGKSTVGANPLAQTSFNMALAAAGGGLSSYPMTRNIPLHTNDLTHLKPHLIVLCHIYNMEQDINVMNIQTAADEMELFATVNRKFRHLFMQQELMRTFRCYDRNEKMRMAALPSGGGKGVVQMNQSAATEGQSNARAATGMLNKWDTSSSSCALLKPSNWLDYIKIKPKRDSDYVLIMSQLKARGNTDELLKACCYFLRIGDPERVQDALRHHALLVQHPPILHTVSVVSNKAGQSTMEIFKKIYTNPELYREDSGYSSSSQKSNKQNGGSGDIENTDNYDFQQTMQMLGLDDEKVKDDPSSVQGAYLSFLHLRLLKVRDMQRTCLSVLNYFRSIERTLTINDEGLSLEGSNVSKSPQNHRSGSEFNGQQGGGGNLGSHGYLFNTPREFKMSETEFMNFAEVENHDDFYYHEFGRIHVQDQAGHYIIYDCALNDYEELEKELLIVATEYLEKDTNLRSASLFKRKRSHQEDSKTNGLNVSHYAHRDVDRYGIIYDLWSCETAFLEAKKDLMDIYMEAYQHVVSRDERRRLAQSITDLMHRRPRFDLEEDYFVRLYQLESVILRLETDLIKRVLNQQIEIQRDFLKRCDAQTLAEYGVPRSWPEKIYVAPLHDENVLLPMYFLEYHSSLAVVTSVVDGLQQCLEECYHHLGPTKILEQVCIHKSLMENILKEFSCLDAIGNSFNQLTRRNVFMDQVVEDPPLMISICQEYTRIVDGKNTRGDKRTRKISIVNELGRLFELIQLRFRLLDASYQTEVLSRIYRDMASGMGYDEYHLFMRFIQMESAKKKAGAEAAKPPMYITSILDDDAIVDKFVPSALPLAINEMDESHVGRVSFRDRDNILLVLNGTGLENLRIILKSQLTHKNALASAVLLGYNCYDNFDEPVVSPEGIQVASTTSIPVNNPTPALTLSKEASKDQKKEHSLDPEAFFSIQLEKSPSRDRVINKFVAKTTPEKGQYDSGLLRNANELEKLKREIISEFNEDFSNRVAHCSLRAQIVAYFNTIRRLLVKAPTLKTFFFTFGTRSEKKTPADNTAQEDPRTLRERPRRNLSEDGSKFLNLWFIPHYTEILFLFKQLDDIECGKALRRLLRIVAGLHDILHYLISYARLATTKAMVQPNQQFSPELFSALSASVSVQQEEGPATKSSKKKGGEGRTPKRHKGARSAQGPSSALPHTDLAAAGGAGAELKELQSQINSLSNPEDPEMVADLLDAKRRLLYLTFDVCIRHVLRETFLSNDNMTAFKSITENMHFALRDISDAQRRSILAIQLNVPEPMEARDEKAKTLFPWMSFLNSNGEFSTAYRSWHTIEKNLSMCIAGLNEIDRPVVHGELLALNLCLEEVLQQGELPEAQSGGELDVMRPNTVTLLGRRYQERPVKKSVDDGTITSPSSRAQTATPGATGQDLLKILAFTNNPLAAFELCRKYFILWKRLEIMKMEWAKRKLGLEEIRSFKDYKLFCKMYKSERLYPLLKVLAAQYNQADLYEFGPYSSTDIHIAPKGIPDIVLKQRQLAKLIEALEMTMIREVKRRINRCIDLVVKEKNREEGNLPLELWKKPAMKETISVKRPYIAEEFLQFLMKESVEDEGAESFTFSKQHLNDSLQQLSTLVMVAQRETFENYAMYYENLLKHQQKTIYNLERCVDEMRLNLSKKELSTHVDVQFQLADQSHNLILEVTALRARVAELEKQMDVQATEVRHEVCDEYNGAMHDLFNTTFQQKNQIDVYRQHLHDVILQRIQESRTEAAMEMNKLKEKGGAKLNEEDALAERNLHLTKTVNEFRRRNIHLQQMMTRLKCHYKWKQSALKCQLLREHRRMLKSHDQIKARLINIQMESEENTILLREELDRVKEYLLATETELKEHKKKLDKELKEKYEKQHTEERKTATDRHLAMVKQMHIEELVSELSEKTEQLGVMKHTLDLQTKTQRTVADKTTRQVDLLKRQLVQEKKLKATAISKAESLLSQVYDYEAALSLQRSIADMRSPTATNNTPGPSSYTGTRAATATTRQGVTTPSTGVWLPMGRSQPKSLTPELKVSPQVKLTRPKTVGAHSGLRSRLAEQLLYNLPPEPFEALKSEEPSKLKP